MSTTAKKILWNGSDEVITKYAIKDSHGNEIDIASLSSRIHDLEVIGRFLSLWNASTGAAVTNPPESPYTYKTGDYFRVSVSGNKIPTGSTYTIGETNYTTHSSTLEVGDMIYYDGTIWSVQKLSASGEVVDVQANGVSVVSAGVANVTPSSLGMGEVVSYTNSNPTTVPVGGINAGTTFTNKSVVDILEEMLYPEVLFSNLNFITTPRIDSRNFEYGTTISLTSVQPTFTLGSTPIAAFILQDGNTQIENIGPVVSGNEYSLSNAYSFSVTATHTIKGILEDSSQHSLERTYTIYPYYSDYYALSSTTTAPTTTGLYTDGSMGYFDISYSQGQYIYLYSHASAGASSRKIQTYVLGSWSDVSVGTTYLGEVSITNSAGATVTYKAYRTTNPMAGTGSGRFRLSSN